MKEQISDLEYTIPSGNFDKFYEAATGNNKCPVGMNDIRRCLMLFYNMKVMGVDVDHVYKQYKERIKQKERAKIHELKDAAIALVERLESDKDVKENNWWLNERAKIMEVIDEIDDGGCDENL
jgi:hypothetical protein